MSYTIQKWDNNTTEIVYKLYAFDSDFIIQKEVLVGNLLESTYYNSNESIETIAAAWTARASKTYDYKLKENLVDNRFNLNFLAFEDSYSCNLIDAARKGINIKVEDFPLLWIEGNGGSGYYDTYTGNTFEVSGSGCVYGGSVSDYAAVTSIDLEDLSLSTSFTSKLLRKFINLEFLRLSQNTSLGTIDLRESYKIKSIIASDAGVNSVLIAAVNLDLRDISLVSNNLTSFNTNNIPLLNLCYLSRNSITSLDFSNNPLVLFIEVFSNLLTSIDLSNNTILRRLFVHDNSITALDLSNNLLLNNIRCNINNLTAAVNSTLLVQLDGHGLSNGYFGSSIFGGGSLTTAGAAAKTSLQGKGWSIVGL